MENAEEDSFKNIKELNFKNITYSIENTRLLIGMPNLDVIKENILIAALF